MLVYILQYILPVSVVQCHCTRAYCPGLVPGTSFHYTCQPGVMLNEQCVWKIRLKGLRKAGHVEGGKGTNTHALSLCTRLFGCSRYLLIALYVASTAASGILSTLGRVLLALQLACLSSLKPAHANSECPFMNIISQGNCGRAAMRSRAVDCIRSVYTCSSPHNRITAATGSTAMRQLMRGYRHYLGIR